MTKARAISLFSGCGGSDLGLKKAGFEVVWANDIWEVATKTYADNLPETKMELGDISSFTKFPRAKLLVGCYPCQGFSQGGRRESTAKVNYLYREFDRVLRLVRPRAFIVENVDGMRYGRNQRLLRNQVCRYRSAGYRVNWKVLAAQDFGVPQARKRLFIVGIRSDLQLKYHFPKPSHGPESVYPYVTQQEVIGGKELWPVGEYCDEPLSWYYLSRNRRHDWNEPSPCIVGHWRNVPLHPVSPTLRRIGADKWKFSTRGKARRYSFRECALLQGFPPEFQWNHGSTRSKFKLIGNAVPPPLFEAVANALPSIWN